MKTKISITRKLRRINPFAELAIQLFVICIFFVASTASIDAFVSKKLAEMNDNLIQDRDSIVRVQNEMQIRQDSIYYELDKMKAGVSDVAARRYKITNAVSIIRGYQSKMGEAEAMKIANIVYDEAERNGVDYAVAMAVITVESRFNPDVNKSSAGAKGLCQMMPQTFLYVSKANGYNYSENDVTDLKKNTKISMIYLGDLTKRYKRLDLVAAGYNGGPRIAENVRAYTNGDTTAYIPEETKKYMGSVQSYVNTYRKTLGDK